MGISKRRFSVEIRSDHNLHRPEGFRYLLYRSIGEHDTLVYESHRFRLRANCVAKADEHLERVISWDNMNSRISEWAA